LALCYENGLAVKQDLEKAKNLYEHASESGDSEAMYRLAHAYLQDAAPRPILMYKKLPNIEKDIKRGLELLEVAALSGSREAMEDLALLYDEYYEKIGVEQDIKKSIRYYQSAANMGSALSAQKLQMIDEALWKELTRSVKGDKKSKLKKK